MSALDEDGFLGGRIEAWIREHRASHKDLLTLAEALNRESHVFLNERAVTISDTKRLTSIVLFARMMELYQSVLLVVYRGSRSGTRVLFRAFLEAFFISQRSTKMPRISMSAWINSRTSGNR